MINYEDLLKRYMRRVLDCEGTDFTSFGRRETSFTEEEMQRLREISDENAKAIWPDPP